MCNRCKTKPVIKLPNSEISLCKACFLKYFERKVRKTIRQYKLFKKGQHIGIALSGGKDSLTTLYILNKITKPQKITKLTAIAIDEGIKGYRDETLKFAKKICKELDIPLRTTSYKKEFGKTLDQILRKNKIKPCTVCGVFRRFLLNKHAQRLNFDIIATGHNLDDEAQSILMNQFRNNISASARLGPITGIKSDKKFIRRIKPLYFLTEKEIMTYAYIKNLATPFNECPYSKDSYRGEIRNLINNFDKKYPSSKHAIINSFIETLPLLKKGYKSGELKYCKSCGEPSSKEICQTCNLIKEIK
jgi:tRNA-5-methyluridine54 2-sulfurtransferase